MIDLPQAVDPKKNRHAESLLARDVARICEHFARRGVSRDPAPDRRRPLDRVDVRRSRSGGAASAPVATVESHPARADTPPMPERRIATVLMLDVVGSTHIAAQLGDARYRELSSRFNRLVRARPQALRGEGGGPRRRRLLRHLLPAGPSDQMRGSARRGGPEPRHRDPLRYPHRADGGSGRQDPRHRGGDRRAGDVAGRCRRHPGHEHHEGARDRLGIRFRGLLGTRAEGRARYLAGLRRHRRERRAAGAAAPGGRSSRTSRSDRNRRTLGGGHADRY